MPTPLTVFVTSKRIVNVQEEIDQLQEAGFTICTREDAEIPGGAVERQDIAGTVAQQIIEAINRADAVVVVNGSDWGRASHEERAIAVAFNKPVIIIDEGCYPPSTPLEFHPLVRPFRSHTVEEAIVHLVALRGGLSLPEQSCPSLPAPAAVDGD